MWMAFGLAGIILGHSLALVIKYQVISPFLMVYMTLGFLFIIGFIYISNYHAKFKEMYL